MPRAYSTHRSQTRPHSSGNHTAQGLHPRPSGFPAAPDMYACLSSAHPAAVPSVHGQEEQYLLCWGGAWAWGTLASLGHVGRRWGDPCLPGHIPFSGVPPPALGVCQLSLGAARRAGCREGGCGSRHGIRDWVGPGPAGRLSLPPVLIRASQGEAAEDEVEGPGQPCWKPACAPDSPCTKAHTTSLY